MNTYALKVNLPILADGYELPVVPKDKHSVFVTFNPEGFINPKVLEFFQRNAGITFDSFQMFALPPNVRSGIHTDTAGIHRHYWAINWVLNPEHSVMSWYKVINEGARPTPFSPGGGSAGSEIYKLSDVELVEEARVGPSPALVRVDVPHCVYSSNTKTRWCISLRAMRLGLTWDEAVAMLRPLFTC